MPKFTAELSLIIHQAGAYAEEAKHRYLSVEHLLWKMLDSEFVIGLFSDFDIDMHTFDRLLRDHLAECETTDNGSSPIVTVALDTLLKNAELQVLGAGKYEIGVPQVFVEFFDLEESYAKYLLELSGLDKMSAMEYVSFGGESEDDWDYPDTEEEENDDDEEDLDDEEETESNDDEDNPFEMIISGDEDEDDGDGEQEDEKDDKKSQIKYTVDMVEEAAAGQYDKLIGRENEIQRTIEILCRRQKNNPIHVGDPGVGKTAITEGLAAKIASDDVPDKLKGFKIFSLDVASMVAGTHYRGDFEKRMKKTLNAVMKLGHAIIFIDEIHTVLGAGDASGGVDMSAILKPYLARGQIRCIGATTYEDYKQHFEKDKAFARRFQKVDIPEPTADETMQILQGLKQKYEEFHGVTYSDAVLNAVVDLSGKYLTDRRYPDKAIDIIDELGSHVSLYDHRTDITVSDVENLVASSAKIPVNQITEDETAALGDLEDRVRSQIFAQDEAVHSICNAVKRHRVGLGNPEKPIGSYLLIGPTGVGKTELCRVLSKELSIPLLRYDMSEFMEKHTISRLIGAPPGYVGYEQSNNLTDAIRKSPHCILLLDEIEKAHPDIFNALLQIMDHATLTDSTGRDADFRNVLLMMTSNVGAAEMNAYRVGFDNNLDGGGKAMGDPMSAVKRTFSPEFRNRLDDTILFGRLDRDAIDKIVVKYLDQLRLQLSAKEIELVAEESAMTYLADNGYSPEFGARPMARLIQNEVRNAVTEIILADGHYKGTLYLRVKGDKLCVEK